MLKVCILDETKRCTECGECDRCDLDPRKLCDNCCRCIEDADYRAIGIDEIIDDTGVAVPTEPRKPVVYRIARMGHTSRLKGR